MMANQIGGQSFLTMKGPAPLSPAMEVKDITRDSADGAAFVQIGARSDVVEMITEIDTNSPSALMDVYRGMMGSIVTVVYTDGKTINNVCIRKVEELEVQPMVNVVGGLNGGSNILVCKWTLQAS